MTTISLIRQLDSAFSPLSYSPGKALDTMQSSMGAGLEWSMLTWQRIGNRFNKYYRVLRNPQPYGKDDGLITAGGTFSSGSYYYHTCGVLKDGKVIIVPQNSSAFRALKIYDPVQNSIKDYSASNSFYSVTLLKDGRAYICPGSATTAKIYDPIEDRVYNASGVFPGGIETHDGAVLLPDGRVFCVPSCITTARIYDPIEDKLYTPAGVYPSGSFMYSGAVVLPDERVYVVPCNATTARIYDPKEDTLTTPSGTFPGSAGFAGGVLLSDGRVFCCPCGSTTARIYDPIEDTLTTPSGTYSDLGTYNYTTGLLLPDGTVFCCPRDASVARIYNPMEDKVTIANGTYTSGPYNANHFGAALLLDGRVYVSPCTSTTTAKIWSGDFNSQSKARVLSSYDNSY